MQRHGPAAWLLIAALALAGAGEVSGQDAVSYDGWRVAAVQRGAADARAVASTSASGPQVHPASYPTLTVTRRVAPATSLPATAVPQTTASSVGGQVQMGTAPQTVYVPATTPAVCSGTCCAVCACLERPNVTAYSVPALAPAVPQGIVTFRPLLDLAPEAPTQYLGKGIFGQPKVYVPNQPIRNVLRYLSP